MKDKIFYTICFGFLLGVLTRSFILLNFYLVLACVVIMAALLVFGIFISKNNFWILILALFFSGAIGVLRFQMRDTPNPANFEANVGNKVTIEGRLVDEPTFSDNNQKLDIQTEATNVLVTASLDENFKYGDVLEITGVLKKPENFITDRGKEFDYVNYLKKDGILYSISYPKIEILERGQGNFLKSGLFKVKEKFLEKINFSISEPENLLMAGLILGEKSSFDESLRQSFVDTGTIHIISLSGYNVTIVAEWFMKILSFLSLNFALSAGILAIILFILMTGASSTAIRAGIMAVLALVARGTGRNYDVGRALTLAATVMIFSNPLLLRYDVSFQLSFLATIAVIFFAPRIEKYFTWVTKRFELRDILSVTTAAYIFVFPFILYKMGNLSLVALPANFLILPFVPFTMMLGFITGIAGMIWYGLAVPVGFLAYCFLHYELLTIEFFAKLPFASYNVPDFSLWLTVVVYIFFTWKLFGRNIIKFYETKTA